MSNDIYSYIKENFGIEITDYQFKRDYILNSLKRGEKPFKEDLEYLYLVINLSLRELSLFFNVCLKTIKKWNKIFLIKKSIELSVKAHKKRIFEVYGTLSYSQTDEWKERMKENYQKRYGSDFYMGTKDFINKSKETCLKKYGHESFTQTEEYKEKTNKTSLEKYGVDYYLQSKEYKDLYKNNDWNDLIQNKKYKTLLQNGSYKKSKQEDEIYELLTKKYPDVIRQYKSDLYPWKCDFYIPELDLYIEYQGSWMHGKEPYIGSNEQKEIIKLWKSKNSMQFLKALDIWIIKDPLKRETAKNNKLNYLEFFNMKEFIKWYEKINKSI